MAYVVTRIYTSFHLSFGEETGRQFAFLMWPHNAGCIPFIDKIHLLPIPTGFVLAGHTEEESIAFTGLSEGVLADLFVSDLSLIRLVDDDYETMKVSLDQIGIVQVIDLTHAVILDM